MDYTELEINTTNLGNDVQKLKNCLATMEKRLGQMQSEMDRLNGMWSGPANQAMRQAFQKEYAYCSSVCGQLNKVIDAIAAARKEYESCERQVNSAVSRLPG